MRSIVVLCDATKLNRQFSGGKVHFTVTNNCLIRTRISLPARYAHTLQNLSLSLSSRSLSLSSSSSPSTSVPPARRRNIVINNPFWLVFAGAPDRRSSPLPLTDNLLPQTTCVAFALVFFHTIIRFGFNDSPVEFYGEFLKLTKRLIQFINSIKKSPTLAITVCLIQWVSVVFEINVFFFFCFYTRAVYWIIKEKNKSSRRIFFWARHIRPFTTVSSFSRKRTRNCIQMSRRAITSHRSDATRFTQERSRRLKTTRCVRATL